MGGGGGGRGRSRTQRKHFAQNRDNTWKRSRIDPSVVDSGDNAVGNGVANTSWQSFTTQNPSFDAYYKEQGIVSPEEWDAFIACLRKPLPAAFRINSSSQFCSDIKSQLENDFYKSLQSEFHGDEAEAIRPLPWYPENLAWHSNFSRMQLRKNQSLERFHEFLKLENEIGNITRQEAVSMVPPLFLDVHPSHSVLDMCAAPGSKTFQLLEIIHRSTEPGSLPDGLVVANDLDVQRCNLLIHQTKRMCTANLVVTNHEAQQFPGCRLSKGSLNASEMDTQSETSLNQLVFDRVLCDVPCSGDGTLRKAPDIWRKWNSGMGNGLHGLQVQIASRGLALVKVGGRMVYSTCSMNPVENEAVVATILRNYEGSVELLDVSNELPQLVRRPGLRKWKVYDKSTWIASYKDVKRYRRGGVIPSMFPSGQNFPEPAEDDDTEDIQNGDQATKSEDNVVQPENHITPPELLEAEVSDLPLDRCMRIVPHDQNAGAFFIAVLRKTAPLANAEMPSKQETSSGNDVNGKSAADGSSDQAIDEKAAPESLVSNNGSSKETELGTKTNDRKRKLQMQGKWKGVDPVVFFKDEAILNSIKTFYGIVDSFPLDGHLVTRNSDTNHVKRIYYISKSAKQILNLNFQVGQQLKITSIGLKMFERQSSLQGTTAPCLFRISSEGLPMLLPYITKQILYASAVDFKHLLQYKSVKFSDFVDSEFGSKVLELLAGCCVIVLKNDSNTNPLTKSNIAIGCWKGRNSLSVLVTAIDCQELLERLLARVEAPAKEASAGEEMHNPEGTDTTTAQV